MGLKKRLALAVAIILLLTFGISKIHIKTEEKNIKTKSGVAKVILYRKPFSSYSNRIEIIIGEENYLRDFKGKNPLNIWEMEVGDVEGDKEEELALGVYKKSPHHQVMAKRVFLYNIVDGKLKPKFRASRLALPMDDFILYDIDKDGRDEVVSIEIKDKSYYIAAYHYDNFHLTRDYVSKSFEEKPKFSDDGKIIYKDRSFDLKINGEEIILK